MKQELEIIIGSTVTDAVKGVKSVGDATAKLSADTGKAAASISKSYTQINNASKALVGSNNQLSKTVVNAGGTLTSFSRIVQDAPFGIIGVGNNITSFAEQFQFLQKQTGSAGGALKALAGSLAGAGGITLGISLLVTGITQLTQKYGSLGNAVDAILFPLNKQQQLQKLVNDTIKEGAAAGQLEVIELNKLYRATQNVNVPLGERNKIVDQLQKQYPSYFGNLSNEAILAGQAASQYNKLRDAIIGAATSRAIDKRLEDQAIKRLDGLEKEEAIRKKLSSAVAAQANAQKQLEALLAQTGPKSKGFVDLQDQLAARLVNASNAVKGLTKDLAKNGAQFTEIGDAEDRLLDIQDQLVVKFGAMGAGITDTAVKAKKVKTIADVLKELEKDITGLNVSFAAMGTSLTDLAGDKLQKFKKALEDLSELGVRPGDAVFKQLQAQIELLQNTITRPVVKIPVNIELVPTAGFNNDGFNKAVQDFNFKVLTPFEKQISDATNNAIKNGVANIASGIGEAIGGLIAGGTSLQQAFNGIIGIFGGFLKQLGESMIAAGTAAIAAKLLIKNPYTAVAAGIIAVAAGADIQASLSKYPSFATGGGVVGGPTLAMIGDNPGREEYVIPSEVLDKMGGGGGGFIARTEIEGTKLAIIIERALRQQGRANG